MVRAIEALKVHYAAQGFSPKTTYLDVWLLRTLGKPPDDVTVADVQRILMRSRSQATRATYARRLRSMFRTLRALGVTTNMVDEQLPVVRAPVKGPRPLTVEQVRRLIDESPAPFSDIFLVASLTGARAAELWAMAGADLSVGVHGPELVLHGKASNGSGVREQVIPAHPLVVDVFDRAGTFGRLWTCWSTPATFSLTCSRQMRKVIGEGHSLHQLRHTFATRLLEATNGDVATTSKLMRHANVNTTLALYAEVSSSRRADAIGLLSV